MTPEENAIDVMRELIGAISNRTGDQLQDWSAYFDDWAKELAPRLAALTLTWREERPTEAGWYWWRYSNRSEPILLRVGDDLSVIGIDTSADHVDECGGEWAGPLPMPREK